MGKETGFLEYNRTNNRDVPPKDRIENFEEFHIPLDSEERRKQASRCMNCGVPFCQSAMNLGGMMRFTEDMISMLLQDFIRPAIFRNLPEGYARLFAKRPACVGRTEIL